MATKLGAFSFSKTRWPGGVLLALSSALGSKRGASPCCARTSAQCRDDGDSRRFSRCARSTAWCRATRRSRASRDGQGAGGGGHPLGKHAARPTVRARELRGDSARPLESRCSATSGAPRSDDRGSAALNSPSRDVVSGRSRRLGRRSAANCCAPSVRRRSSGWARQADHVDVRIASATNKDLARAGEACSRDLLFSS